MRAMTWGVRAENEGMMEEIMKASKTRWPAMQFDNVVSGSG